MEDFKDLLNKKKITSSEYRLHLRKDTFRILQKEKDFEILDVLGEGSYGEVVAAISPDYDTAVAVKIVEPDDVWVGELLLWPNLEHENVLPLFEIINLEYAVLFITPVLYKDMEASLEDEDFLDNPKGLKVAKKWLTEILEALFYLHSGNMCHLDIKADNVLIDYNLKAVLCDFSFLNYSNDQVERYGVPIPYRPPETCLASEKDIVVDGVPFEMWSYGILALNVLTGHFIRKRLHMGMQCWHRDMYPLIFQTVQMPYFHKLMARAFPVSHLSDEESYNAFNFVQFLLRHQPEDRPSVETSAEHIFLKKGNNMLEKPDDIWIYQDMSFWSCSCLRSTKTPKQSKHKFQNFKFRKNSNRSNIRCQKKKKWIKSSEYIRIVEDTTDLVSEDAERCDSSNSLQCVSSENVVERRSESEDDSPLYNIRNDSSQCDINEVFERTPESEAGSLGDNILNDSSQCDINEIFERTPESEDGSLGDNIHIDGFRCDVNGVIGRRRESEDDSLVNTILIDSRDSPKTDVDVKVKACYDPPQPTLITGNGTGTSRNDCRTQNGIQSSLGIVNKTDDKVCEAVRADTKTERESSMESVLLHECSELMDNIAKVEDCPISDSTDIDEEKRKNTNGLYAWVREKFSFLCFCPKRIENKE